MEPVILKARQDRISKYIRRTVLGLLCYGSYCLLILTQPDAISLMAGGTITIPVTTMRIGFVTFLVAGPIVLIALNALLHLFLRERWTITQLTDADKPPFTFNIAGLVEGILSFAIYYLVTPLIVLAFAFKARAWPEAGYWVGGATLVAVWMAIEYSGGWRKATRSIRFLASVLVIGGVFGWAVRPGAMQATWPLKLSGADLKNQNLSGIRLPGMIAFGVNFQGAELSQADLTKARMNGANLENAKLGNAKMHGVDLVKANMRKADLGGADLSRANLSYSDLGGSNLFRINLSQTALPETNLSQANLRGADLSFTNLTKANLTEADLYGADLSQAILHGADLSGANLNRASLAGAAVSGTDFMKAKYLTQEQLDSTCHEQAMSRPRLPPGFKQPPTLDRCPYTPN